MDESRPVALITGAGSGIGRAAALELGSRGHAIALVGRTRATLEQVAGELQARGVPSLVLVADVSVRAQVDAAVEGTRAEFGRIDLLVNNAGAAPAAPLSELNDEQWRTIFDTNLSSAFFATRAVWPIMQAQHVRQAKGGLTAPRGGAIVNISSMASRDPFAGLGAYGIAKCGVNMLTLVSAREGHAVGIRVVGIAPAAVDTLMFRELVAGMGMKADESTMLRPEDIARMIAEAADGALGYCSGETIFVHRRPA